MCPRIKALVEPIGGWIGGVTGARPIKPADQGLIDTETLNGGGHDDLNSN